MLYICDPTEVDVLADSLQTPGCGFMGRRKELRKVTVGVRFVGQAA